MTVSTRKDGSTTIVTLDRPAHRGAVDRPTADALTNAFRRFDADDESPVAVLTGSEGHFCAGADLKAFAEGAGKENRLSPDGDGPMGPTRLLLSKPVIAAIEGHAVAGGLELALWCDLRVTGAGATFGVFCRRFGVPLIDGGSVRLPRIVGMGRALDMILTGRAVGSEEALGMGLVSRVVPDGQALSAALELARTLASFPQAAMRGDRLSAYEQWGCSEPDALAQEFTRGKAALAEAREGAALFRAGKGRHGSFDAS